MWKRWCKDVKYNRFFALCVFIYHLFNTMALLSLAAICSCVKPTTWAQGRGEKRNDEKTRREGKKEKKARINKDDDDDRLQKRFLAIPFPSLLFLLFLFPFFLLFIPFFPSLVCFSFFFRAAPLCYCNHLACIGGHNHFVMLYTAHTPAHNGCDAWRQTCVENAARIVIGISA